MALLDKKGRAGDCGRGEPVRETWNISVDGVRYSGGDVYDHEDDRQDFRPHRVIARKDVQRRAQSLSEPFQVFVRVGAGQ